MEIIAHAGSGTAFISSLNAIVTTHSTIAHNPYTPQDENAKKNAIDKKIAKWGKNNLFPQEVMRDIDKNPELSATIYWKSNAIISGGLVYGHVDIDANGNERLVREIDPAVEEWNQSTNIDRYLRESSLEFYKFWNVWPTIMMNKGYDYISSLYCQESAFSRWGVQNEDGVIEEAYFNAQWEKNPRISAKTTKQIPVIDPYFQAVEQLKEEAKKRQVAEWIYPIAGTSSGYTYYQVAPWNSIRNSAWLEVANAIPVFKAALMKNAITVKYHIKVPDYFWSWKYPEWETKPEEEKTKLQKKEYQRFTEFLTSAENAGKTIFTVFKTTAEGTEWAGWKIEEISDKTKDGAYLEDSQEASSHIFFSQGVDPTLIGRTPGKGLGAGSGSDKRVAYNIWIANSKPEMDLLLEPVDFCYRFNGFKSKVTGRPYKLWFKNYWITSLDQGKETQQQAK
ncbi:hypothetical protein EFA69_16240 [Rufibacter immobilis]|uniref:Uncharacterized protein n=1 Tax=Rufibacter immobilis TaxID=1348778 RepID=A0A3M9MR33_9BACT|nr:hypothetical protein [Rufibacter immobilis]RNI27667.1 hypothetical protein EFA69_16240 [Rufibacter immobilis]